MGEAGGIVGTFVAALLAAVGLGGGGTGASAAVASTAVLKANYQLDGIRASAIPGAPDLVDLGSGNRFASETVDGVTRKVLAFPRGGGMSLRTTGLVDPTSHSIVMVVRLAEISGFRRLLDVSGGDADSGLYDYDGQVVVYPDRATLGEPIFTAGAYHQVTLTSEATPTGSQRSVVYVDGRRVASTVEPLDFGSAPLRFFRDNERGPGLAEESAGALACMLVYDGALTAGEVAQQADDAGLCPSPRPPPAPRLPFKLGLYAGTTSQGLPITFTVGQTSVDGIVFRWRARCADGRVHVNGISLGGARIRDARFSAAGLLVTGGRAHVLGRLHGSRASGRLSRWANSAFGTVCVARGIGWHAHLVRGAASSA